MDLSRIIVDPTVRWGTPCIRDTDVTVGRVIELHQAGQSPDQIVEQLPGLTGDDIDAALEWFTDFGPQGITAHPPDPGERHPRVVVDPAVNGGHPTIRGTRVPVDAIVGMWERGFSVDEIVADYPTLCAEDVEDAIDYSTEAWW